MPTLPPALHHRNFRLLWLGVLGSGFAANMVAVAVGWQVYAIHGSAFDLGLIGLAEFVPLPLLALPAGQLADRLPRRAGRRGRGSLRRRSVTTLLLVVTLHGARALWAFLGLAFLTGASNCVRQPGGARPAAGARALRSARERARPAVDRLPGGDDRRPGDRRAALRGACHLGVRSCDRPLLRRRRLRARAAARPARERQRGARAREPPRRHPLHPGDPGAARRDLARPVRSAARRRRRAAAALREVDPAHRPRRAWACCAACPRSGRSSAP